MRNIKIIFSKVLDLIFFLKSTQYTVPVHVHQGHQYSCTTTTTTTTGTGTGVQHCVFKVKGPTTCILLHTAVHMKLYMYPSSICSVLRVTAPHHHGSKVATPCVT